MTAWRCSMESGIPPRPRCSEQCDHCRRIYGDSPGFFSFELFSGGFIELDNPSPSQITLEDVAVSLSKICRYTGHCRGFYSVAEHACLVAWRLEDLGYDLEVVAAGLHHDDGEILTSDNSRPLKKLVPELKAVEGSAHLAVLMALGISGLPFDDRNVKEADDWALRQEAHQLMHSQGRHWHVAGRFPNEPTPWPLGVPWPEARRLWLEWHRRLMKRLELA